MYRFVKRLLDLIMSALGIVLFSPLLAALALAVKLDSRGPVFFRQQRVGINKSRFSILKFRTMYSDTPKDVPTHLLSDPDRYITKTGKFLRKTSLDELPQLFNIFSGKMSFVGPRPALYNQTDLVAERDKYGANACRPGLTGWAQINGRDELTIEAKARLDGEYAAKFGFIMDCRCFFGSFRAFLGRGVVEGGTGSLGIHEEKK